jgi:isoleucyl-tRNA synthetase
VLTHGFVVDGKGKKMSKSLGNVISPQDITNKHGAEILRLWTSSADYREDMRISNEILSRLVEAYRKIRNTCRFLLGNIYDLDPVEADLENLNKDDLTEIDRYALSTLQGLIEKVDNAYETFAFHEVYHSIYRFCVTDMSTFYLDILKDRLYTYRSDSKERRAAQAVMYNILISLAKMLAPILSFTAEEIWQHVPGVREESVFISPFPEVKPEFMDRELEDTWNQLARVRDEVNKALEIRRKDKFIGNALEAKVSIFVEEKTMQLLDKYNEMLPELFIVSSVELCKFEDAPSDAFKSEDMEGVAIFVQKAEGSKCQRCWNWKLSVGTFEDHPELCKKCHTVLTN